MFISEYGRDYRWDCQIFGYGGFLFAIERHRDEIRYSTFLQCLKYVDVC